MSLGFQQAGLQVAAAFDYNHRCVVAHKANFSKCESVQVDLRSANGKELRKAAKLSRRNIDVLFGGPPCGGFSIAGQRNPSDERNKLLIRFAELVVDLRPSYFVVENVRGLVIGEAMKVLQKFRSKLERAGYDIVWPVRVLNAADFGVPQKRQRIFILGCKSTLALPAYPEPTTPADGTGRVTVAEAIGDLCVIDDHLHRIEGDSYRGPPGKPSQYVRRLDATRLGRRITDHGDSRPELTGCHRVRHTITSVKRFARTEPGNLERVSRFFRLAESGLSPTLRAGTDPEHGSFTAVRPIHPLRPRCITVREAARLHSFPDWFRFHPTTWHGFMQIGNSVPPLLSRAVAKSVMRAICES